MTPDIDEVVSLLYQRKCTQDQGRKWIAKHMEACTTDAVLLDQFAAAAVLPRSGNGSILPRHAEAVMGGLDPPLGDELGCLHWLAEAEARLRYIKARAMLHARLL